MSYHQEWVCYNPDILQSFMPQQQETKEDVTLIPTCPCCGEGRTLFCYTKEDVNLVIPGSFKNWCQGCREDMAKRADDFSLRLRR